MKRYEYKTITTNMGEPWENEKNTAALDHDLNALAAQGWELVQSLSIGFCRHPI